ncbi:MAG: type II toxin-antitoxin system HicA family toxin [Thermoplasmatales archaeon]|nr:type II toxin-antitoxin system HicA family toxin [Thermoplasmatales archaeon]
MPKLPIISGMKAVKALTKAGFFMDHQTGSHIIMRKEGNKPITISIPKHKEMKTGTLRTVIKQSGLTIEEFLKLL